MEWAYVIDISLKKKGLTLNHAFCLYDSSDIWLELWLIISEHIRQGENCKEKEWTIENNRENREVRRQTLPRTNTNKLYLIIIHLRIF